MSPTGTARISPRGQTTVPADVRRRWGLAAGGELGMVDLGDALLLVPGGIEAVRHEVYRAVKDHYDEGIAQIADPELVDQ